MNLASIFNQAKDIINIQSAAIVGSQGGFAPYVFIYSDSGVTQSQFLAFDEDLWAV